MQCPFRGYFGRVSRSGQYGAGNRVCEGVSFPVKADNICLRTNDLRDSGGVVGVRGGEKQRSKPGNLVHEDGLVQAGAEHKAPSEGGAFVLLDDLTAAVDVTGGRAAQAYPR